MNACPLCGNVGLEPGLCGDCIRELGSQPMCVLCLESFSEGEAPVRFHDELVHAECKRDAEDLAMDAAVSDDFDYHFDRG